MCQNGVETQKRTFKCLRSRTTWVNYLPYIIQTIAVAPNFSSHCFLLKTADGMLVYTLQARVYIIRKTSPEKKGTVQWLQYGVHLSRTIYERSAVITIWDCGGTVEGCHVRSWSTNTDTNPVNEDTFANIIISFWWSCNPVQSKPRQTVKLAYLNRVCDIDTPHDATPHSTHRQVSWSRDVPRIIYKFISLRHARTPLVPHLAPPLCSQLKVPVHCIYALASPLYAPRPAPPQL